MEKGPVTVTASISNARNRVNSMPPLTAIASILMCAGLGITYFVLPEDGTVIIYRTAAIGGGLAIGLGILVQAQRGLRSLIRTDLLALIALYGLTLVEFLFPQEGMDRLVSPQSAIQGVEAVFLGFCGLIVGRHFAVSSRARAARNSIFVELGPRKVFLLYLLVLCIGYAYMLFSVGFDPAELINQMLGPRFSQPWGRSKIFGGWADLVVELSGLVLYIIPGIAGSVIANPSRYTRLQLAIVILGLAFTLFYGFSGGTRNVFVIYVVIFVSSYIICKREISWRYIAFLTCLTAGILYLSAYYMLQFRQVGLGAYIEGADEFRGFRKETLFIDYNLPTISQLTNVFPDTIEYLGWEVPYYAIARPIPRALWPGKPTGLSVDMAETLGLRGLTLSSTFVGEAYMMGGYLGILSIGLVLGGLCGWWNRFGQDLRSNTNVALYVSGFFAAALSMRSMLWLSTAMLPSLLIWLYLKRRHATRLVKPNGSNLNRYGN
jgi:oligosaccharide repeat unit polymerase